METSLQLVRRLAELNDHAHRTELVFENPQLLNPQVQATLVKEIKPLAPQERDKLLGILRSLSAMRDRLESGGEQYILGSGPIERIWFQVENGEITNTQARAVRADSRHPPE